MRVRVVTQLFYKKNYGITYGIKKLFADLGFRKVKPVSIPMHLL